MNSNTRREAAAVVGVAVLFTLCVAVLPFVRFAYVGASARVAMETAQALIAGAVAYLLYGRFRRSRTWTDLAMVVALGLSGLTNTVTVAIRTTTEDDTILTPFAIWSAQVLTALAAVAFVVAAWSRPRPVSAGRQRLVLLGGALAVTIVTMAIALTADSIPVTLRGTLDPGASRRPNLDADASVLWIHLVIVGLLFLAAAGFWRRASEDDDPLLAATATALVVAGIARINFILYPSLYTNVVHTGDVVRLAFYLVLLLGAAREVRGYWSDREVLAVHDERQRIARELHDGLTQELSFIRSQTDALRRGRSDPAMLDFVAEASERALHESRRAIESLHEPAGALHHRIRDEVSTVAARSGLDVEFEMTRCGTLDERTVDHIARVAREAAVNAVRHAQAATLCVRLSSSATGVTLSLADDGTGIDPDRARPGFGMRTMNDRADALGGTLSVAPGPTGGTTVTLSVPLAMSPTQGVEEGDDIGDVP